MKHFTFITKGIEENLIKQKHKYSEYLRNRNANSFFITPTNSDQALSVIKELKNNKFAGPCSIPSKFLQLFETALSKPISWRNNLSFLSGISPHNLKITNVIPIFDKDECTISSNYCQISISSNISKIIGKLIHSRLTMSLMKKNISYESNSTFHLINPRHINFRNYRKNEPSLLLYKICLRGIPWFKKGIWYCQSWYIA